MTQRNSSTPDVHLRVVDLQGVEAVDGHGRESLVDLDEVNVIEGKAELGEQLGNGDGWADTHDAGSETSDGGADVLGEDGLAELLGCGALHHQDGGATVGKLRRVAGMRPVAVGQEGRLELLEALKGGAVPDTLVLGQCDFLGLARLGVLDGGLDGRNLIVEPARLLRDLGSPV